MIEVLIRLDGEEPRREMMVRAQSIVGALCVAEEHSPAGEVSVVFPIDADRFFVGDAAETVELDGREEVTA